MTNGLVDVMLEQAAIYTQMPNMNSLRLILHAACLVRRLSTCEWFKAE
jgi:hypothetical protein